MFCVDILIIVYIFIEINAATTFQPELFSDGTISACRQILHRIDPLGEMLNVIGRELSHPVILPVLPGFLCYLLF